MTNEPINWAGAIQAGTNAFFGVVNTKLPRFPRASEWLGGVSEVCYYGSSWMGIPIGPLRLLLVYCYFRRTRVMMARMSLSRKLVIGATTAVLTGLVSAFGNILTKVNDDEGGDERSSEELKEEISKALNEDLAQKEGSVQGW